MGRKVRWRCATHERYGCKARIHTIDNEIVYFVDEHITEEFITGDRTDETSIKSLIYIVPSRSTSL